MARRPLPSQPKGTTLASTTAMSSVKAPGLEPVGPHVAPTIDRAASAHPAEPAHKKPVKMMAAVAPKTVAKPPAGKPSADVLRRPRDKARPAIPAASASPAALPSEPSEASPMTAPAAVIDAGRAAIGAERDRLDDIVTTAGHHVEAAVETGRESAAAATASATEGVATLAELNARVAEAMRSNIEATVSFWTSLLGAGSVSQATALNTQHMRRQLDAFATQSRELTSLAQKIAGDTFKHLSGQAEKPK